MKQKLTLIRLLSEGKELFGDRFEEIAAYIGKELSTKVTDMNNAINLLEELHDLHYYKFG